MILPDFKDFPASKRIIGIDWGARRIGIAISDDSQEFVFARPQIESKKGMQTTAAQVWEIIAVERPKAIVLGLPLYSDGTESATTLAVRAFANDLAMQTDLPIFLIDEFLTSMAAAEELGDTRKNKNKLDSYSAKIILENAIAMARRINKEEDNNE